jgi:hypothetical protein
MDDANLISNNSKERILKLYNICSSFFKLCKIKVNLKKFKLLMISKNYVNKRNDNISEVVNGKNISNEDNLNLDSVKVYINKSHNGVRFLSVWLNNELPFKSHNLQIKNIVKRIINIMR